MVAEVVGMMAQPGDPDHRQLPQTATPLAALLDSRSVAVMAVTILVVVAVMVDKARAAAVMAVMDLAAAADGHRHRHNAPRPFIAVQTVCTIRTRHARRHLYRPARISAQAEPASSRHHHSLSHLPPSCRIHHVALAVRF